ncbi:MAG: hypothetical protein WC881_07355, partial [Elusimicrobiota bacterium]
DRRLQVVNIAEDDILEEDGNPSIIDLAPGAAAAWLADRHIRLIRPGERTAWLKKLGWQELPAAPSFWTRPPDRLASSKPRP